MNKNIWSCWKDFMWLASNFNVCIRFCKLLLNPREITLKTLFMSHNALECYLASSQMTLTRTASLLHPHCYQIYCLHFTDLLTLKLWNILIFTKNSYEYFVFRYFNALAIWINIGIVFSMLKNINFFESKCYHLFWPRIIANSILAQYAFHEFQSTLSSSKNPITFCRCLTIIWDQIFC